MAPYLPKEQGVNRYERIVDFDFSAGNEYWERTSIYWQDVRDVWQEILNRKQRIQIVPEYDDTPLFRSLFKLQESLTKEAADYESGKARARIREILDNHVSYPVDRR